MRIAHLCLSCFYIDGYNYQENVLPRQHKLDGHEVLIVASTENYGVDKRLCYVAPGRYLNEDGIPVIRLPYRRILPHAIMKKLRMHPGLARLLEEFRPDVILFHGLCGWEILSVAAYAKRHSEVSLYADSHEDANNSGRGTISRHILHGAYYRSVLHGALSQIRTILCVSVETMDFVRDVYRVPQSKLEFFPLGGTIFTDEEYNEKRQRIRNQLSLSGQDVVIIQAGKMGRKKKVIETLQAFRSRGAGYLRLLLIGSLDDEVRREVESLLPTVPNATYLGWKDAASLMDLLCAADVYLQPGSQSAIMQNALCARCPVILDDVPSHRPFVDGNGWLLNGNLALNNVLDSISEDSSQLITMSLRSLAIARDLLDYRKLASRICC